MAIRAGRARLSNGTARVQRSYPVRVSDLSVTFADTRVLESLTFEVPAGGSIAITGPSGSGKSTLLHCIIGLIVPARGSVEAGGLPVSGLDERSRARFRREQVGLVFQEPELLPELSVEENVALVAIFDGEPRKRALAGATTLLETLSLEHLRGRRVQELSGGEAQRVALARALTRDRAQLLVADEPTASLDAANVDAVTSLLVDGARAKGATLVVATHDQRVSERMDARLDISTALHSSTSP